MLTAERFALTNSSYWTSILPRLEHFVRVSNTGPRRFDAPLEWRHRPRRHALVSETAFYLWAQYRSAAKPHIPTATDRARQRLREVSDQVDLGGPLDAREAEMSVKLAHRIEHYSRTVRPLLQIEIEPTLPGCGWLSGGRPDIFAMAVDTDSLRSALIEVKTVNRPYRSVDLRQLVVYIVLYYSAHKRIPEIMAIVNPLLGTSLEVTVEEFFSDVVGASASDVVNHLAIDWSTAGVSP